MLIDGEKWACEACVRGHRVSNCQHIDRPLTHINKKGRPVSQCPHCRGLRKSRASHVKCECGEKPHGKDDCVHMEVGDSKSELGDNSGELVSDLDTVDSEICCCTHGARCTCALKKEHLDPVPESDVAQLSPTPPVPESQPRKPRLASASSDSSLTVFSNGHHKPAHKHNDAAHKCGAPYKIPRPHSIHGHSEIAQRSVDSLPLTGSVGEDHIRLHESFYNAQQEARLVRSEHGSPELKSTSNVNQLNSQLPQLDLSFPGSRTSTPSSPSNDYNTAMSNGFPSYFSASEEQPMYSAALSATSVDWSAFDLPFDSGAFSTAYSQPPSYASFDHSNVGQPGLTTSSSGDVSEVDDFGFSSPPIIAGTTYTSGPPDAVAADMYRQDSGSSYMGVAPGSVLGSNSVNSLGLDSYLQDGTASPADFEEHQGTALDQEAFARHGFTVQDAQKMAHPGAVPVEAMGELAIPTTIDSADPLWAAEFPPDAPYDSELESSTNPWVS